jgi:hypothetical protein
MTDWNDSKSIALTQPVPLWRYKRWLLVVREPLEYENLHQNQAKSAELAGIVLGSYKGE